MSLVLSQAAITNLAVAPEPFDDIEDMFDFRPHLALPPIPLPVPMVEGGAAIAAALEVGARRSMDGKQIVTIIPSFAERYLSTALFEGMM